MLNRFVITLGAPTTAGGQVITADDFKTVEGRPVAREGDKCWCPQCRTEGVIALEGPR
ncbi:PAAR domain-containing protein, partial [Acinetobacter baumannii]|uniref:PAAR domain-containing protein n=1 Tax=Acinetobacter baumannii TaxID=470 RepID=UPI0018981159|nr:PAAR domain-containing protein [Acinetobacter baumannii]